MTTAARRTIKVKRSKIPATVTRRTVAVHEKQARAAELRAAGVPFHKIADELGYASPSGAKNAVVAFLNRQEIELAENVVMMDLVRLDEYQMRATAALRAGDLKQIPILIQIMNQKYALARISPRTVEKIQQRFGISQDDILSAQGGGGLTNNGVMVIGGSESDFVRSLMIATGNNPDDPKVQEQVKQIETAVKIREQQYGLRTVEKSGDPNEVGGVIPEADIVDAEIVEDE